MQVVKLEYNAIPFLDTNLSNRVTDSCVMSVIFNPGKGIFLLLVLVTSSLEKAAVLV